MRKSRTASTIAVAGILLVLPAGFGLIVSQFAGEPTLDDAGNLYFVHHYFEHGQMIEADIYVAYKK